MGIVASTLDNSAIYAGSRDPDTTSHTVYGEMMPSPCRPSLRPHGSRGCCTASTASPGPSCSPSPSAASSSLCASSSPITSCARSHRQSPSSLAPEARTSSSTSRSLPPSTWAWSSWASPSCSMATSPRHPSKATARASDACARRLGGEDALG
eukprot:scaffold11181_cov75-Phaeocystis_antarctica.AAC.1